MSEQTDRAALARALWHEGLIIVYRLLFILKLESSDDPARSFTFASTSLWRNTFSPSMALARYAPKVLYDGAETGGLLEHGLRGLFRMFHEGVECTELNVKPLGGALFGADATPVLSQLRWGERAVAHLLDQLLWTTPKKKGGARERVHYGPLDVEDLGRVYEALLELEPGIATEPMCRLRRQKLEVVVPVAQGEKYRPAHARERAGGEGDDGQDVDDEPKKRKPRTTRTKSPKTRQEDHGRSGSRRSRPAGSISASAWAARPPAPTTRRTRSSASWSRKPSGRRSPSGRRRTIRSPARSSSSRSSTRRWAAGISWSKPAASWASTSTKPPACATRRPPPPSAGPESAKRKEDREAALAEAQKFRQRVIDLPDPDDELLRYLPSRSVEGEQSGVSQRKAEALCRRMVAVHCLYGVDKNPLAVELAKLALWLESHAEGMPLTFLDHRLVVGDSLTGPFWERLLTWPSQAEGEVGGRRFSRPGNRLRAALFDALRHVKPPGGQRRRELGRGQREADRQGRSGRRPAAVPRCRRSLGGGVMLGPEKCDDVAYAELLQTIATTHELPKRLTTAATQPSVDKVPSKPGRKRTTEAAGLAADAPCTRP